MASVLWISKAAQPPFDLCMDRSQFIPRKKAFLRGINWVLSMQSSDGGWAAFDIDNTKAIFTYIPFADHNAMIDPPTADVTSRVMEVLGLVGDDKTYPCVQRAISFMKQDQEADGSWYG